MRRPSYAGDLPHPELYTKEGDRSLRTLFSTADGQHWHSDPTRVWLERELRQVHDVLKSCWRLQRSQRPEDYPDVLQGLERYQGEAARRWAQEVQDGLPDHFSRRRRRLGCGPDALRGMTKRFTRGLVHAWLRQCVVDEDDARGAALIHGWFSERGDD